MNDHVTNAVNALNAVLQIFENAVKLGDAHDGQHACSKTCQWCGVTITDAVACEGEFACSSTCQYCGEAVTPPEFARRLTALLLREKN